jgi:hypothetical protein
MQWVAAVLFVAMACGGPSAEMLARARTARYDAELDTVLRVAADATASKSRGARVEIVGHRIRTAWFRMEVDSDEENDPPPPGVSRDGIRHPKLGLFLRFEVDVGPQRPFTIHVTGQASRWEPGLTPVRLQGADEPPWVRARADSLQLAIYQRLRDHADR